MKTTDKEITDPFEWLEEAFRSHKSSKSKSRFVKVIEENDPELATPEENNDEGK
jgi:hypothetical protein